MEVDSASRLLRVHVLQETTGTTLREGILPLRRNGLTGFSVWCDRFVDGKFHQKELVMKSLRQLRHCVEE
jgi:hypothetical protein